MIIRSPPLKFCYILLSPVRYWINICLVLMGQVVVQSSIVLHDKAIVFIDGFMVSACPFFA